MIRLSWRQFRGQAVVAAAALAITAVVLGAVAPHLFHLYDASGMATCQAHGNCVPLATGLVNDLNVTVSTPDHSPFSASHSSPSKREPCGMILTSRMRRS